MQDILSINKAKMAFVASKTNEVFSKESVEKLIQKGFDVYSEKQVLSYLLKAKEEGFIQKAQDEIACLQKIHVNQGTDVVPVFVSKTPSQIEKAYDENLSPVDLDIIKGGKVVPVGTVVVRKNGVKEMKTENGWKYMGKEKSGKDGADDSLDKRIDEAIKESNIPNVQSNSGLKNIIKDALSTIKDFGYEKWEKETTLGKTAKEIVKKLSGEEKQYLGIKSSDALQKMSKEDLKKELSSLKEQRGEFNTEDGKKMFTKLSNKIKEIESLLGEEKEPTAKQESKEHTDTYNKLKKDAKDGKLDTTKEEFGEDIKADHDKKEKTTKELEQEVSNLRSKWQKQRTENSENAFKILKETNTKEDFDKLMTAFKTLNGQISSKETHVNVESIDKKTGKISLNFHSLNPSKTIEEIRDHFVKNDIDAKKVDYKGDYRSSSTYKTDSHTDGLKRQIAQFEMDMGHFPLTDLNDSTLYKKFENVKYKK